MGDYVPRIISIEVLNHPSIERQECVDVVSTPDLSWMDPIISFISYGVLPSEAKEAKKIRRISARFQLSKDKRLYRLSFGEPYLICLHPGVVEGLLTKLHEGICDSHIGGRSLAHRVMMQ